MAYNRALADARDPGSLEDDGNWELIKPELSLRLWKLWRSFGDREPLFPGGLANWPDWVIHDFKVLEWLNRIVRHALDLD